LIDALKANGGVEVLEGVYQLEPVYCGICRTEREIPKEKQTDTSIATEMLTDAFMNKWDTAYLISADSDLVPPILRIKTLCPEKRIVVAFPPSRISDHLKRVGHAFFYINEKTLVDNQLPNKVLQKNGVALYRPEKWNH